MFRKLLPLPKGFYLGRQTEPQPAWLVQWLDWQFLNDHGGKQS